MAVTNENSNEYINQIANPVVHAPTTELTGRQRVATFSFTQGGSAGDANSTIELLKLLNGKFRITEVDIKVSAFGASRLLSLGHRAAVAVDGFTAIAEDLAFFASAIDVAAAGHTKTYCNKKLLSQAGTTLVLQCTGGTIPSGATVEGFITYVND